MDSQVCHCYDSQIPIPRVHIETQSCVSELSGRLNFILEEAEQRMVENHRQLLLKVDS